MAGSLLFRGPHVEKPISVLSGGERARLCLAGLLLSDYNVLILDEPGNHLDVDTVEALAEALLEYEGTVIFTSHDRHFTKRVATCIVEVRDGRVTNYSGQYEAYVYKVNKEIEAGERELATARAKLPPAVAKPAKAAPRAAAAERTRGAQGNQDPGADDRPARRTETRAQRRNCCNRPMPPKRFACTTKSSALTAQLAEAEERWCQLQEESGATE